MFVIISKNHKVLAEIPKLLQKGTRNGTTFGTPLLRISGVRETPNRQINESGEKATGAGIILSKRKGGKAL